MLFLWIVDIPIATNSAASLADLLHENEFCGKGK